MPSTPGFGGKLAYADLGESSFTDVAQTVDVGMPSTQVGVREVVHNDLANATKEKAPGLLDPQEFEVSLVYTDAQATALYTLKAARAEKTWKVTLANGATSTFDGFITNLEYEAETDDGNVQGTLTIQLTTIETYTAAPSS